MPNSTAHTSTKSIRPVAAESGAFSAIHSSCSAHFLAGAPTGICTQLTLSYTGLGQEDSFPRKEY